MSYTALYRKYRPNTFAEIIGQDHVVESLQGAVSKKAIAHAYLFSGSRGIGKTSIARIFAREIGTTDNDLYEIDAASNRGIDDVRALRDAVSTVPLESKYKVYIIDEVHMLTKEAFNALLKTLEEPPAHIVFILATTEIEKLPDTVVSRCQVFNFKRPTKEILAKVVENVAKKEGYTIEGTVADLIADVGDGAYRDTLGTLQKVISRTKGKKITMVDAEEILGTPSVQGVHDYMIAFLKNEKEKGFQALDDTLKSGTNATTFSLMVLDRLRAVLLLRFSPQRKNEIETEYGDEFSFISEIAGDKECVITSQKMIQVLDAVQMVKTSPVPQLPLELLLID